MALDLLLIADHPYALRDACLRGWWGPLLLPSADTRFLSHLAVLHPQANAIEQVARIQAREPWPQPGGPQPGEPLRWLLVLQPPRTLRRPIPLGRGRQLNTWRPRGSGQMRLLSIDGLLMSDSLADYLERLRRSRNRLALDAQGLDPRAYGPGSGSGRSAADPWR